MSKKIVTELSDDALIRIATNSGEEVVMDAISEAARFIYDLGIKHGKDKIPTGLIFHTYKEWHGSTKPRQSRAKFFRDFKKYFDQLRDKNGTYYLLNGKSFDLSEETKWIHRKIDREQRRQKRISRAKKKIKHPHPATKV
jgi:hypothetical protein